MRESALLSHIYARSASLSRAYPSVLVGPGDDCAVVAVGDQPALLKVDQVVEGRHFTAAIPADLVARKAMARAISDIAAMAGTPLCALASAVLPAAWSQARADELFDAMARWSIFFAAPLVGGDISIHRAASDAPLTLSVTIVGRPHPSRGPVLRSSAAPADELFVTGALGGSLDHATGLGRHLTFSPRLAEAAWLADTLGPCLHAMMDISDGLGIDAGRLALASGLRIQLDPRSFPLSPGVLSPDHALRDGEDYELLFAVPPGSLPPVLHAPSGCPITRIGTCLEGTGAWIPDGDRWIPVSTLGWDHGKS